MSEKPLIVGWRKLKEMGWPYSRAETWRRMARGDFPKATKLGNHRNAHPVWRVIEHFDKHEMQDTGWFGRKKKVLVQANWVKLLIELTDDEKAIVEKHKLGEYTLYSKPNPTYTSFHQIRNDTIARYGPNDALVSPLSEEPPKEIHVKISWFLTPDGYWQRFETISDAKNFAGQLREHIQKLKDIIDHNATPGQKESYDL